MLFLNVLLADECCKSAYLMPFLGLELGAHHFAYTSGSSGGYLSALIEREFRSRPKEKTTCIVITRTGRVNAVGSDSGHVDYLSPLLNH